MDRTVSYCAREIHRRRPKTKVSTPRRHEDWAMGSPRPIKYSAALARLRRRAKLCGIGAKFTLHSPRAVLPTWDAQLVWHEEDRTALGRCVPNSEMPNWYDRAVCNAELRLRNEIVQKIQQGWKPPCAFELPKTRRKTENDNDLSSVDSTPVVTSSGWGGSGGSISPT